MVVAMALGPDLSAHDWAVVSIIGGLVLGSVAVIFYVRLYSALPLARRARPIAAFVIALLLIALGVIGLT